MPQTHPGTTEVPATRHLHGYFESPPKDVRHTMMQAYTFGEREHTQKSSLQRRQTLFTVLKPYRSQAHWYGSQEKGDGGTQRILEKRLPANMLGNDCVFPTFSPPPRAKRF